MPVSTATANFLKILLNSFRDNDIREKLIKTGHVDVMISVGNNFFYTKSLPCSLWFFDKGKAEKLKDKVLFIDARNYYTVVDRTLNEWSEWQLKNLNAIVWLYRGEIVQLSKGNISTQNVRVEFSLEDMDMSGFQQGATYEQIQEWIQEKYGFHVTHLNIAKTKRKCGIIERQNNNLAKSENSRSPDTPKEKEEAIIDAFLYFKMM